MTELKDKSHVEDKPRSDEGDKQGSRQILQQHADELRSSQPSDRSGTSSSTAGRSDSSAAIPSLEIHDRSAKPGSAVDGSDRKSDKPSPTASSAAQISEKYGVRVVQSAGSYEYHMDAGGKDQILFKTSADQQGLESADKQLHAEVARREQEIEKKYHVQFSKPGELLGHQYDPEKRRPTDVEVRTKEPTLKELAGLEAALKCSYPACLTREGGPLRISFQDKDFVPNSGEQANYIRPHDKKSAEIRIGPGAADMPATEKDVTHPDPRNPNLNSLEGELTHELAHGTQVNVTGGMDGRDTAYYRQTGWEPLKNPPDADTVWALRGKDGFLYEPTDPDPRKPWIKLEGGKGYDEHHNYKGRPVDKDGKVSDGPPKPEDAWVSSDQVRPIAEVTPSTHYFTAPKEMMAESMARYRLSEDSRRKLQQESPQLYEASKRLDQQELDLFTKGAKVRMPDGSLVDNDAAHREAIRRWETAH